MEKQVVFRKPPLTTDQLEYISFLMKEVVDNRTQFKDQAPSQRAYFRYLDAKEAREDAGRILKLNTVQNVKSTVLGTNIYPSDLHRIYFQTFCSFQFSCMDRSLHGVNQLYELGLSNRQLSYKNILKEIGKKGEQAWLVQSYHQIDQYLHSLRQLRNSMTHNFSYSNSEFNLYQSLDHMRPYGLRPKTKFGFDMRNTYRFTWLSKVDFLMRNSCMAIDGWLHNLQWEIISKAMK